MQTFLRVVGGFWISFALAACGDNGSAPVSIGGTVEGLEGSGLVLRNGGEELAIGADGAFAFATPTAVNHPYAVTVVTQPTSPSQTCTVVNGSGTAGSEPVTDIAITCQTGVFTVGGTVSGMQGTGLVLQNNGTDDLAVDADGTFTFPTPLASGTAFAVTIQAQPTAPSQTCTVSGAAGTIGGGAVTSVVVDCATDQFTIGGVVAGLSGTVVLQNNGGDDLVISANGAFAFPMTVASGASYAVSVLTQPSSPSQTCVVSSDAGTVAGADISSVRVDCTTDTFVVGGSVTGLAGTGLVLQNNAGDSLAITGNGAFAFATPVASGATYAVTVLSQPTSPAQVCAVTAGSGTVGDADVTTVAVTCATTTFTIGGTVSGLAGSGLVLHNNGGDPLLITGNGTFTFAAPIASGATYAVTVQTQPAGPVQTCTVAGGAGTVGAGNVTSVAINCATDQFAIGGTISGLAGTVTLRNNGGDDLVLTANGGFAFAAPIASGATYAVTVFAAPTSPSQTCTVTNGSGTVAGSPISSVTVTCVTNRFVVRGTVAGLAGGGLVLRNNGGDPLAVTGDGAFAFATSIASGTAYAVTVGAQPTTPSQTCVVGNATGVIGGGDVTDVTVTCTTDTFLVGGSVTGLAGTGLVLQNNGGGDLAVSGNGTFSFTGPIASGGGYAVTVLAQPTGPSQTCAVTAGSGTVTNANITTIAITCTTNSFVIGGMVSGLAGSGLVLRNNAGDDLGVTSDGPFAFATPLASGATFSVTIATQPSGPTQTCTVSGGSGTVGAGDVTSVVIDCATDRFAVGGSVSGLVGSVVLRNNGGADLVIMANGAFAFPGTLASGETYAVTVATQPSAPSQTCVVTSGTGTVLAADVTSVVVTCTTDRFTVGGTVSGLAAGQSVILRNNGADDLIVDANDTFTFATTVLSGAPYSVTVLTQPASPIAQTCTVTSGSGTVGGAAITDVVVTCTTNELTIGGTVTGLAGSGLVLQNNAGDNLAVVMNGDFTFTTPIASGATYAVTVLTQPASPTQTCVVTGGSGTVGATAVTDVAVTCTTTAFTVGGTVTGLVGTGLVLQNSGGDDLAIVGGTFTFTTPVASGVAYDVTVLSQPGSPSQTCSITNGSGTVADGNVTNVAVTCATTSFTVGGMVNGLTGTGLVLQNSGGDNLPIAADGTFTFGTPVASGATYDVTVLTQPTSPIQTCTVTNPSGAVGAANVTDVVVNCATATFTVGGTVSGLAGTGLVLQNNGANDLMIVGGTFTFTTPIASGATYDVTVLSQPGSPAQTCSVTNGSGTVADANVTDVVVTCATTSFTVGGTVTGLAGTGLALQNGGDNLPIAADGSFTFPTPVASGATYDVSVASQPGSPAQTCTVASGSGTVGSANVTNIVVTCATTAFTIGGSVTGLAGTGLVLQNNGGDDLLLDASGPFTFATPVASGAAYAVTVLTQPGGESCVVNTGAGTVAGADVTTVEVICSAVAP